MESPKHTISFIKATHKGEKKARTIIHYDKTHLKSIVQQELALFLLTKVNHKRLEIVSNLVHIYQMKCQSYMKHIILLALQRERNNSKYCYSSIFFLYIPLFIYFI